MVKRILISVFLIIITFDSFADFWENPEITVTYSQNKEYALVVYPRYYPKDYSTVKYQRQYKQGITTDTIIPCYAVLYHLSSLDTTIIWKKLLVNFTAPCEIVVSNDGKSIVTIDDWFSRGTKHTIVIYNETGEVVVDFTLKEISPFPLNEYEITISSIWWKGRAEYLDNDRVKIYFRNKNDNVREKIFDIVNKNFE
jgi:hypothetical protein